MTGTLLPVLWGFGWILLVVLGITIIGVVLVQLFGLPLSAISGMFSKVVSSTERRLEARVGKRFTPWVEALLSVLILAAAGILLSRVGAR